MSRDSAVRQGARLEARQVHRMRRMILTRRARTTAGALWADPEHKGGPACEVCLYRALDERCGTLALQDMRDRAEGDLGFCTIPDRRRLVAIKLGWRQIQAGDGLRCAHCVKQLVISYCVLAEEMHGADEWTAICSRLKESANAAALLCLEIEASEYRPGHQHNGLEVIRVDHAEVFAAAKAFGDKLRAALVEPRSLTGQRLVAQTAEALKQTLDLPLDAPLEFAPTEIGTDKLRAVAVGLRRMSGMDYIIQHNFAGVVRGAAKDPHNLPRRLPLVVAYQWAQELRPPMGAQELAAALIHYEAAPIGYRREDKIPELAKNIREAVAKYQSLGKISTRAY